MNNENIGTVVLGFGPQQLDWLSKACKICGKDAVMDPDVARMAGANLAAGDPEALAVLRKQLEAGALKSAQQTNPGLSEAATRWLASGERGVSSNTMFKHLTGVDALSGDKGSHPWDTDDFRRCRLLLEQVPELEPELHRMARVSKEWSDLVYLWTDICMAMDAESPHWRNRQGTSLAAYQLIKRAIGR